MWYHVHGAIFTKLRIEVGRLEPYHGGSLVAFSDFTTKQIGSIILSITFKKEGDHASARTIQVRFLVLPCDSNYNCILGRTTLTLLGAVPSTVHLKLKYHDTGNKIVTIEADKRH
jgi:hypothetical protein